MNADTSAQPTHSGEASVFEADSPEGARPVIVVRYSGTLGTKASNVRSRFLQKLGANIHHALQRLELDAEVQRDWNRLYVEPAKSADLEAVADPLRRIPGIQAIRPAYCLQWDNLDDIVDACRSRWAPTFRKADRYDIETFAVEAQRVGDRDEFDFTSPEAARRIGTALDAFDVDVDLENPDIRVGVDIHADEIFLYGREQAGPGGLPIGSEGKALAMISGGFDSAVAAQRMYRRGVDLDFVFFQLADQRQQRGARNVLSALVESWAHGSSPTLNVVDFRPVVAEIRASLPNRHWQIALKRWMYRAAELITDHPGSDARAVVTGEAIGQVATQTLTNLAAIETGIETPVFRPLVSMNKEDIVQAAREIGIYDIAESQPEYCALQRGRQVTECPPERLDDIEAELDDTVLHAVLQRTDRVDARETPTIVETDIRVDSIPEEAVPVDVRREEAYEQWHPPDALHVPFDVAIEQGAALPREPTYLFYCDVGLKSAHVAEHLRQKGINAYSFDGSVQDLKIRLSSSG